MTRLHRLYDEQGQSPWLDNLTRPCLRDGTLAGPVADGIRGVTANPTTFARSIDAALAGAHRVRGALAESGIDLEAVGRSLEDDGVAGLHDSFSHRLGLLEAKSRTLQGS